MFDLVVFPEAVAKTPRHFGVNVELQEHHDEVNLWDWLADSGATIVREFHPEQSLRKGEMDQGVWDAVLTAGDFEAFRKSVRDDPAGGPIQWDAYHFDKPVRWIGVPDGIIRKVSEIGVKPLVSMGYGTVLYPRPLVGDLHFSGIAGDDAIDWSAAASAYDYYFAMIYHFAEQFGSRYFLMHNEPECCLECFRLPPEYKGPASLADPEVRRVVMACMSTQWGVLARIARAAIDDVQEMLGIPDGELFLSGPASGDWMPFWRAGGRYMDSLDYHHYHPAPGGFTNTYASVATRAGELGKRISVSEFNVLPGNVPFPGLLFNIDAAIEQAHMLMQALRLSGPSDPVCEFMTLYLLHFPATHRNHKELLYGDMNLLDWTTRDLGLINRPDDWYPTLAEQQVRHPTVAYSMYRMLSRCVPGASGPAGGHPVLRNGIECLIDDAHGRRYELLDVLVVDAGELVYLNLLNRCGRELEMPVNLRPLGDRFVTAVVRETAAGAYDAAREQRPVADGKLVFNLPPKSLTQVILTPLDLDNIESLRVTECTTTPGTSADLGEWQTTRFRALATIGGQEIDVTTLNAIWTASDPYIVHAYQGGLIQRTRNSGRAVTVTAAVPNGVQADPIAFPPASAD